MKYNLTTFETAQIGDEVYDITSGWAIVIGIDNSVEFPIITDSGRTYTHEGFRYTGDNRVLFWDQIIITAPYKPMPELAVDTKVLVWDFDKNIAVKRYFSHFTKEGKIVVFYGGTTSWSAADGIYEYNCWEVV